MKKILALSFCVLLGGTAVGQIDSTLLKKQTLSTDSLQMNMDAVYSRPFMSSGKSTAVGGYVEANWQQLGTDGVSEGHQFQFQRMTLFVASTISEHVSFMSEIELEEGGKEIAIEFAALDLDLHPMLNLRTGIVMNPIGSFNQNHDGPKWEFVDRPISATQMLPATWSNVGFGLFGQYFKNDWKFGYEAYITSGFDQSIIENDQNRTYLPSSKANADRFEEGHVLYTGKLAVRHKRVGEIGVSFMTGKYNDEQEDGLTFDRSRWITATAIDFSTKLPVLQTTITGEIAKIWVDVPSTYSQQFGSQQQGGFVDFVQPIIQRSIFHFSNVVVNLALRLEYVDWNVGDFVETGGNIGDEVWSVVPGLSFRTTQETVFRANYRFMQSTYILGNPPAKTGGFSIGVSSYF